MDPNNNQQKPSQPTVSTFNKEKEVIKPGETLIRELGKEVEIPPEAQQAGIVQRQEQIEIPPEMVQMGIRPTGISTPVPFQPTLKLPITDERIEEGRHQSIFFSLRWLSEWCLYILRRFHLTLKMIHGKVMRVRVRD